MRKHIVIDQNVFRKEYLLAPVIADAQTFNELIIIPDIAFAEMMKAPEWESTTRRSLKILANHAEIVSLGHSFGFLTSTEKDTGSPCSDIIDHEMTPRIREFLNEVKDGGGPIFDHVKTVIDAAQDMARRQHFDNNHNKQTLRRIVAAWKHDLLPEQLKKLRQGDETFIIELLSSLELTRTCRDALIGAGYEESKANRLVMEPSISAHLFFCLACYGIRWLDNIDTALDATLTNDLADLDYIVTASFCRKLVSEETRVHQIFDRLNTVIIKR